MATMLVSSLGLDSSVVERPVPKTLRLETLKQLFPIRDLPDDVLESFALNRKPEVLPRGSVLFHVGEAVDSVLYLIAGTVATRSDQEKTYRIEGGTTRAKFPLSSGSHHSVTIVAVTEVQVLRICPRIMQQYVPKQGLSEVVVDHYDPSLPASLRTSKLFQSFSYRVGDGNLDLKPLAGVAAYVQAAASYEWSRKELARMLAWDPILSAKLVQLANSPLYLTRGEVLSCRDAIAAVGSTATQRLIVGRCVNGMFRAKNATVRGLLGRFWKKSVQRAAVCQVLAADCGIDPYVARMAGLIADIGEVPLLEFVDDFADAHWSPQEVELALPYVRSTMGPAMLRSWGFPQTLVDVAILAENWYSDCEPTLSLSDLVTLANLLVSTGRNDKQGQPPIQAIPAWRKFGDGKLTPEYALQVLHKAKLKLAGAELDRFDPVG